MMGGFEMAMCVTAATRHWRSCSVFGSLRADAARDFRGLKDGAADSGLKAVASTDFRGLKDGAMHSRLKPGASKDLEGRMEDATGN
jgi:hypothetical protein